MGALKYDILLDYLEIFFIYLDICRDKSLAPFRIFQISRKSLGLIKFLFKRCRRKNSQECRKFAEMCKRQADPDSLIMPQQNGA
jgi:hypothetical protein